MTIPTIIDTDYERRFIGGGFTIGEKNRYEPSKDAPYIKGYFLVPTKNEPCMTSDDTCNLLNSFTKNMESMIKNADDASGLGTAILSPISGYRTLLLWKESVPIVANQYMWHKTKDGNLWQINYKPCTRELNIFGLEIPHYMKLLKSRGTKGDIDEYAKSWAPNQELI